MLKILDGSSPAATSKELGVKLGETLGEKLGVNRKKILEMMMDNENITIPELSKKLKISTTAVENNINYLRKNKLIERIGSDKSGYWKVLLTNCELGEKLGVKLGVNRKKILEMIKENKSITIPELSQKLGISKTAIEKNMKYLKKSKLIERIGPAKGGSWRVLL